MTERDQYTTRRDTAERRELEAAGWEPKGRGAKTIWRSLTDGHWYALFNVGEAGSAALSQAVGADETQLIRMIELADLAADPTIAKAAFAAGVVRGDAPQAVRPYLDSNPEAEPLLRRPRHEPWDT
jgi:hypothetical protein